MLKSYRRKGVQQFACIFSQNSGDVFGMAVARRTLITAEIPARPLSIREKIRPSYPEAPSRLFHSHVGQIIF